MALLGLAPSSVGGAKSALCGQLARLPCIDLYGKLGRTNPHDAKKSANAASPIKPPESKLLNKIVNFSI
ncbi:unnamed protein product [Protopolystoma xenopodis]|uniref:Uncharacterized protein n=1 Tax=Protopolystoma xenopodis TaxID=117903 RepID=A0A3S5AZN1_9PLAT|nr:unnamed protein product [Protopolystoma xenopodis]